MFLVKFGAEWCQPCRKLEPQLAQIVENNDVEIFDVDVDEVDADVLREYGVISVPALLFFSDEDTYDKVNGAIPPKQILEKLGL